MIRRLLVVLVIFAAVIAVSSQAVDELDQSADLSDSQPLIEGYEPLLALPATESDKSNNQSFRWKFLPSGSYVFETMAIIALGVFFLNLSRGRSINQSIATRIFESLVDRLNDQFAVIGSYGQTIPADCLKTLQIASQPSNQSIQYYKGSLNEFSLSFTGRNNVDLMVVSLETVKRHDFISLTLSQFQLSAKHDHLLVECVISRMPPLVFAVVRKKFEKRMRKNVRDLELYTHTIKQSKLPHTLSVMADNADALDHLMDPAFVKLMSENDRMIVLLHVSDQAVPMPGTNNSQLLSLKLELPSQLDEEALQTINQLVNGVLSLIDRLSTYQMSGSALTKAQDMRRRAAEVESKKSKDDKKKEQPIKKEKDGKKAKMKVKAMRG